MTNIEDVVRDVALKNRQSVKEDDPVMALVTIMNRIALDWQSSLDRSLEAQQEAHEELAHRWRAGATKRAEKILNAALEAGREAMAKGMTEGAEKVLELMQERSQTAMKAALVE